MARSLKKGFFVDFKLNKRVQEITDGKKKYVIKTWSRRSMIAPEFALTRTFKGHAADKKAKK